MDSNCNLYYIDDEGHRIPAPLWREEQLWSVDDVVLDDSQVSDEDFIESMYEHDEQLPF
ncbi:hypothetical protein [Alkalihalobacillus sp. BA299]|uniref:hypothetical protein n=1 Tax=Alkalihalobacillus sp. BA299 TaxID=2815938 RepID=UPI001ADBF974|nr:hypothetical protein [Alkalihalobacillus sp. BA299]